LFVLFLFFFLDQQKGKKQRVPAFQREYEASGLKPNVAYEFWVTASTVIGEGKKSKAVTQAPNAKGKSTVFSPKREYSFSS
jgi:hypothetical protein